ncbi:serine/threonine-protein phosphatase 6 regulatory ankyrin repeat subunit C-like [Uloborus diversus]|uniref:serine/threonine-protein phosphatase 6 regulatory ankyrin repeat subunit C-like n=1 Tax=Uloborus diversus TaxID=327109 RepID=UPI0024098946|nr:serine/threonine-protein phosphatase 6 regulatory ankyrin repeat subunit C-like [Uloborus diversus]
MDNFSDEEVFSDDSDDSPNPLRDIDPCMIHENFFQLFEKIPKACKRRRTIHEGPGVTLETKLHCAVAHKDASAVLAISTNEKSLIDIRNKAGKTALHMAIESSTAEMVQILLEAGANARVQDQNGWTALHSAAWGKEDKLEIIINHDGVNSVRDVYGRTALHVAAINGHEGVLKKLLAAACKGGNTYSYAGEGGNSYNLNQYEGSSVHAGDNAYLALCEKENNFLNVQDHEGETVLHIAARGSTEMVKMLLEAGASARLEDRSGYMPVHIAVINQMEKNAEAFFDHDNGDLLQSRYGLTSLHYAAKLGFENIVRMLLSRANARERENAELDCDEVKHDYVTALGLSAENRRKIIDMQDKMQWTALHTAANWSSTEIVRMLLTAGADTHQKDKNGYTPLHVIRSGSIAEILCDHDGGNCLLDIVGRTPLHYAVKYRRHEVVENLLFSGVHPHVLDKRGTAPLVFALSGEDWITVQMIISAISLKDIKVDWNKLPTYLQFIDYCQKLLANCNTELQRMKDTKILGHISLSYYDVMMCHVNRLAVYLENSDIQNALSVENLMPSFPNYARMIAFKVRKAERRRILNGQCVQCFSMLSRQLPFLPKYTVDNISVCLNEIEMRNFVRAFK